MKEINIKKILQFIIPSLIGILLFMMPVPYMDGKFVTYAEGFTIPIAIIKDFIQGLLSNVLSLLILISISITFVVTLYTKLLKPKYILNNLFLNNLFNVSWIWTIIRIFGTIFVFITYYKYNIEMIYSSNTGGLLLNDLMPILFIIFFLAGLLLPLILDFGLLEFVGVLSSRVMRPLFGLPGRSSVDCITSWLGDGTIGVLLTNKQLIAGYYTKREAAVIATSFSAVSITFCLVVISQVKLESYFLYMIATVAITGIVCAIILPKLFPLSKIEDTFIKENENRDNEVLPKGKQLVSYALEKAVKRADSCPSLSIFLKDGFKNVLDMWLGVLPIVMCMGTIALVLAEETPVFTYLGLPFIPYLELLQIPDAALMSETIMVGFADMFLPSVIGASIESDLTRFVIACLSVSQLIYMSEVGGLILATKIPVSLFQLFLIFLLRTLISLPIIAVIAHQIF
ncbi:MAG: YjiH family protein [Campylobacterales bacterium]|nr:YjiH family protein [Campylobacterales bacterium]